MNINRRTSDINKNRDCEDENWDLSENSSDEFEPTGELCVSKIDSQAN